MKQLDSDGNEQETFDESNDPFNNNNLSSTSFKDETVEDGDRKSPAIALDSVKEEPDMSQPMPSDEGFSFGHDDEDDFGGFASFEEAVSSQTKDIDGVHKDTEPDNTQKDDAEENDFDEFASFEAATSPAVDDADHQNDLTTGPEDTSTNAEIPSLLGNQQHTGPVSQPEPVGVNLTDDDDFGDFGDFEEVAPSYMDPNELPNNAEQDIGVFGDFEEVTPTDMDQNELSNNAEQDNAPAIEDDDFGEFADFEEVPPSIGDFEEMPSTGVEPETKAAAAQNSPATILSENVRAMFENVFEADRTGRFGLSGESSMLPFDVTLRSVLVSCDDSSFMFTV
jgi:hypothetical protein